MGNIETKRQHTARHAYELLKRIDPFGRLNLKKKKSGKRKLVFSSIQNWLSLRSCSRLYSRATSMNINSLTVCYLGQLLKWNAFQLSIYIHCMYLSINID